MDLNLSPEQARQKIKFCHGSLLEEPKNLELLVKIGEFHKILGEYGDALLAFMTAKQLYSAEAEAQPSKISKYSSEISKKDELKRGLRKIGISGKQLSELDVALQILRQKKQASEQLDRLFKKKVLECDSEIKELTRKPGLERVRFVESLYRQRCLCQEYQNKLQAFESKTENISTYTFSEQVQHVLDLLNFLIDYNFHEGLENVSNMKKQQDSLRELVCYKLYLDPGFWSLPTEQRELRIGQALTLTLEGTRADVFFDDLKNCLRMIFKTLHCFPRDEREGLIRYLPRGVDSWYLFDFCGAIFCSDRASINATELGGIHFPPPPSQAPELLTQVEHFRLALSNHSLVVKAACADILTEIPKLASFFAALAAAQEAAVQAGIGPSVQLPCDLKMDALPHLELLLRYTKWLFSMRRLLCLLPLETEQPIPGLAQAAGGSGLVLDLDSYAEAMSNLYDLGTSKEDKKKIEHCFQDIFQGLGIEVLPGTSMAARLLHSCADRRFDKLKVRLAWLRRLQLIGDIFSGRNLISQEFKKIDYINAESLREIRAGFVHMDSYLSQRLLNLEDEQATLGLLFSELAKWKQSVYASIAETQSQFIDWPFDAHVDVNELSFENWKLPVQKYWQSIQHVLPKNRPPLIPDPHFIPGHPLLNDKDRKELEKLTIDDQQFSEMLNGLAPWQAFNKAALVQPGGDEERKILQIGNLLSTAQKKYRKLQAEDTKNKEKDNRDKRLQIEQKIRSAMESDFRVIQALRDQVVKDPAPTYEALFSTLQNRLAKLKTLLQEQQIKVTADKDALKDVLEKEFQKDVSFFLASIHLLPQIILFLGNSKIRVIVNKIIPEASAQQEAKLRAFTRLRNHLEHIDPIFESQDLPYYEMQSKAPKAVAAVIADLIYSYHEPIRTYSLADLPGGQKELLEEEAANLEPIRQQLPLNPEDY